MNNRGFIMILVFVFMLVLAAIVTAAAYFVSIETRSAGFQLDDTKALYLAQAGLERALREIRDDVLTSTQTGTADLRGADTTGSTSVSSAARISYVDDSSASINDNDDRAYLRTFDSNYTQTRIVSVLLFARASRANGGTGATLQVSYTTNGAFPQAGNTILTAALTNTMITYPPVDITADRIWDWATIMNSNFVLLAQRTAGNRNINLDAIWIRVTYEIDTNTEPWHTGSYAVFPLALGDGTIETITIADEAGKVHLNYASQSLLRYLMEERTVASGMADTVAANIVNYRGAALTDPFDSVEELQQVSGMTQAIYDLIKDYVTVYSFINTNSYRPPATGTASRAPININTAPREVLEAVFDPLNLGASDPASLAADIINTRATAPFTCFYSSDSAVTTDFYDFARSRPYLSLSGNPDEQDKVLDNADASDLIPVSGSADYTALTTEFCYAAAAFKIESVGKVEDSKARVKTILGDDGSRVFQNYVGDAVLTGYWKENYE